MKKFIVLVFILGCNEAGTPSKIPPVNDWDLEGWKLVWNDEFESSSINRDKWSFEEGGHGWVIMNCSTIQILILQHLLEMVN